MMREVLPGVLWLNELLVAPSYLLKDSSGTSYTMIDCGLKLEQALLALILEKYAIKTISRLFLTHSHPDHAGNASWVMDKFRCPVFCSSREKPYLLGKKKLKPRNYKDTDWLGKLVEIGDKLTAPAIVPKARSFESASELKKEFDFILVPGHTPGSTVIRHKNTNSVFLGDCLLNRDMLQISQPEGLLLPQECFSEDRTLAIKSLSKVFKLEFENAFFGHGTPIIGSGKKEITEFLIKQGVQPPGQRIRSLAR